MSLPRRSLALEAVSWPCPEGPLVTEPLLLDWRPYRFRLPRPMVTAHGTVEQREGWLLRLRGPQGTGWGEALAWPGEQAGLTEAVAPLHGAWRRQRLEALLPSLPAPLACALGSALAELAGEPLTQEGCWLPAPPSAWLLPAGEAAQQALTQCLASLSRNGPGSAPGPRAAADSSAAATLPGAALSPAAAADPRPAAAALAAAGTNEPLLTVKWKVAAGDDGLERRTLERLLELLPPTARLRLDANGGWDRPTAAAWARRLAGETRLEWLEQPLDPADAAGLLALAEQLPVALDESLRSSSPAPSPWPGWQVRRPLLEGDPRPLLAALRQGQPRLMVSTALETGVGRRWLAHLAALQSLGPTPVAPGLAPGWRPTGDLFAADPQRVWRAAAAERCR